MKKLHSKLALILIISLLFSIIAPTTYAIDNNKITVYFSMCYKGKIAQDQDGQDMIFRKVTLTNQNTYSIDDVLYEAHDAYFEGGTNEGYGSENGTYGKYITMLWGNSSGNFGYQLNFGDVNVMSLSQEVHDGDYLDCAVYKNYYPDTENYTKFDKPTKETIVGEDVEFELSQMEYNEKFEAIFNPCAEADILVNNKSTSITTDENGKFTYSFPKAGTYYITASKTKRISHEKVPAITTPICVVTVDERPEVKIIHNIFNNIIENGISSDENYPWFLCDIASYKQYFTENNDYLSDKEETKCVDKLITLADEAESASDLAKVILALRALGYDARKTYTRAKEELNIVKKLTDMVDEESTSVTNVYTLPYVIIALRQFDTYATAEELNFLINTAIENKSAWQDTTWGCDAAAPMILALSPYYKYDEDIKTAIDDVLPSLYQLQNENGLVDLWGGCASTGLLVAALSSIGIDPKAIENNDNNLIDGIMSQASENLDAFLPITNSFSTEQAFRGLIAWKLSSKNKTLFDFSNNSMKTAYAMWAEYCPVTFITYPLDAEISIYNQTEVFDNSFDLQPGNYSYTVKKSGYKTKSDSITITAQDVQNKTPIKVNVTLTKESTSSGGGGGSSTVSANTIANVKVLTHNELSCNNSFTYKNNSNKYTTILTKKLYLQKGATVFDAIISALSEKGISYSENNGYFVSIDDTGEFAHGQNSGWMFTIDGKLATKGSREITISKETDIVLFYTDDYTLEDGTAGVTKIASDGPSSYKESESNPIVKEEIDKKNQFINFTDINADSWYYDYVKYVYENGYMQGTNIGFEPNSYITRAMLVTVLYRLDASDDIAQAADFCDVEYDSWYYDAVNWARQNMIAMGISDTLFGTFNEVTREEVATIFYNYSKYKEKNVENTENLENFTDFEQISDWAKDAFCWAKSKQIINGTSDNTLSPKNKATRAELAKIIKEYIEG